MSTTSPCTSKRKRGEQSAEEPAVVRRSARQKVKGQESIIERAMNRKKVNSLELNSPRVSKIRQQGRGRTAQSDSSNISNEPQPPPASTGVHINRSWATLASTSNQVNSVSRNHVSNESPAGLNPQALEFQSACTVSSKDELPKVHSQGKLSASSSIFVPWTETGAHELLPTKSHTRSSAVMSDKSKHNDCKTSIPNHHHPEKPVPSSLKHGYVNRESTSRIRSSPETATRRVSQSNIAGSNHTTIQASQSGSSIATIQGSGRTDQTDSANIANVLPPPPEATGDHMNLSWATLSRTSNQVNSVSRKYFSNESPAGLNPHALEFQSACTVSSKDELPKVHSQGKLSASSSIFVPWTETGADKYNDCKTNSPKHHHPVKPVSSSLKKHGYINCESIRSSSETATRGVSQSNIACSNHTTIQASQSGSSIATIADAPGFQIMPPHFGQRKDAFSLRPISIMHSHNAPVRDAPGFQMMPPHFGQRKDAVSLRPISIMHSHNAPVRDAPDFQMMPPHFGQRKDAVSLRPISIMHSHNAPVRDAPDFQMMPPHFGQRKDAVSLRPISIMHSHNAPVRGRRTPTNYGRSQFVPRHNPQRTYSPSSPTILHFPTVVPRVANPSFQNIPPHSGVDKGTELTLPPPIHTTNAFKVPAQGLGSPSNTVGHQYDADNSKLSSTKSYAGCTTKPSPVRENDVLHVAKNRSFNVAKAAKKSVLRPSKPIPMYYIKSEGSSEMSTSPPPLVPLGERCHLCGTDLAFAGKGSDSQTEDPPFAAVLPCSHSYHDHCIANIFGAGEPPCVRCLEDEPPQGS